MTAQQAKIDRIKIGDIDERSSKLTVSFVLLVLALLFFVSIKVLLIKIIRLAGDLIVSAAN